MLATVVSILDQFANDQVMCLVGPSLDMLAAVVEGCPGLTDALLDTAFPALMRLLINSEDMGVMGAGG